ncbi:MAG TPA: lamin tail domain-containing protein, partial [Mycobacteriales bacterium]|nr:lamin tail domain-containing protein [Mycobacteriales bacterium]
MSLLRRRSTRIGGILLAIAATVTALVLAAPADGAVTTGPIINEVYGGGGNSGSTWKSDFIELANRGDSPIDLTGWSVQDHSRSATGTWQVTPL